MGIFYNSFLKITWVIHINETLSKLSNKTELLENEFNNFNRRIIRLETLIEMQNKIITISNPAT